MATRIDTDGRIDIGSVVQRGFAVIGRHWAAFLLLALLFGGVPSFLTQFLLLAESEGGNVGQTAIMYFPTLLFSVLAGYMLQAIVVRSVILDLSGRPADYGGSLAAALRLILPMIGLSIVSSVAIGLGMLLLIVPGVILYVMWIVAVPVLIEEQAGVIGSLGRSADLTKGSRWRIFALLLLFAIAWVIIWTVVGFAFGIALTPTGMSDLMGLSTTAGLLSAASATIVGVLASAMLASLYVELRTVKEGASTDTLAAVFE